MKKIVDYLPLLVAGVLIIILLGLFTAGAFDAPKQTVITSSVLVETTEVAKLSPVKFIHHGIAKTNIEGKGTCYILYYATVLPIVELSEINFDIDHENKTVTLKIPNEFEYEVELLRDENHEFHYYPADVNNRTSKEIQTFCEEDAKQTAAENVELNSAARENLINSLTLLLDPLLSANGYTIVVE